LCTPETQYKEGAAIFVHRKLKNFAAACLALRTRTVASFWTVARRYILGQETMHFFKWPDQCKTEYVWGRFFSLAARCIFFFCDLTRLQGVVPTIQYIWPFTLSTDFLCLLSIIGPLRWLSSGYFEKLRAFCTQRTHLELLPASVPGLRKLGVCFLTWSNYATVLSLDKRSGKIHASLLIA
jgi:hypothetical protein